MKNELAVYIQAKKEDIFVGTLFIDFVKGKEVFSFAYDKEYLSKHYDYVIDPSLTLTDNRQFLPDHSLFGFLQDIIPDRWGKTLLSRRYKKPLSTYDYLTLISDKGRMGAIRIKENDAFVNNDQNSIPAYIFINSLEQATYQIEDEIDDNIKLLIDPGSSLGGARPKANIYDNNNEMYIAKFPSKYDDYDVELYEAVVNDLAELCSINVPTHKLVKLSTNGSTLLLKRFDRNHEERIPYISMMSMLAAKDGDSSNYSYLDLLDVIITYSVTPKDDAIELYKRLIFNVVIHNGDDHLRNHGLLRSDKGYVLSPAFDLNPSFDKDSLTLSIDGEHYDFDLEYVKNISLYFGLTQIEAEEIINNIVDIVLHNYKKVFQKYHATNKQISVFETLIKSHL